MSWLVEYATKSAASAFGWLTVEVEIENHSGRTLLFRRDWYNHGYVEEPGWPEGIRNGEKVKVKSVGRMLSAFGVSGLVTYEVEGTGTPLTIAFSCPSLGTNKVGAGTGGMRVWDEMTNNEYDLEASLVQAGSCKLNVAFQSCSGIAAMAQVKIYPASQ